MFGEIRARRLECFSITDHDCLGAYPVPPDLRDRCIPGLEVDSHYEGHTVHILAYGIADSGSPLLRALQQQRLARHSRMEHMIARLNSMNVAVRLQDVAAQAVGASSLGRPHLARALVAAGYVPTVQAAFDRYIADEGEGYVALQRLSSAEITALIHESGGLAIVAHPLRLREANHLRNLLELGIDGVEVVHPTADRAAEAELERFATEHGLLVTGGSDFHAPVANKSIGVSVDAAAIERLKHALARPGKAAS